MKPSQKLGRDDGDTAKLGEITRGPDLRPKTPAQLRELEHRKVIARRDVQHAVVDTVLGRALDRVIDGTPTEFDRAMVALLDDADLAAFRFPNAEERETVRRARDAFRLALTPEPAVPSSPVNAVGGG